MTMIHATLANGKTCLFLPDEFVCTADWVSEDGEYFSGDDEGLAEDKIIPGVFILEVPEGDSVRPRVAAELNSRIVSVRLLDAAAIY